MNQLAIRLAESGRLPDPIVRWGIRRVLKERLRQLDAGGEAGRAARHEQLVEALRAGPIARTPDAANEQHYEVPTAFFRHMLGRRLKYSCCLYEDGDDLAAAEERALRVTCERAELTDEMSILELGCGWGSLTLWMAERFPRARIVAVTGSERQRHWIEGWARTAHRDNLVVVRADMNELHFDETFDRVVSVEMFEHMWNLERLLARIAGWLSPDGKLFVHHFCHRDAAYSYEDEGSSDWMARHFFTGGVMPSRDLLTELCGDAFRPDADWLIDGSHYARTCRDWLARLDDTRTPVLRVLDEPGQPRAARLRLQRWRIFLMACAELFDHADGEVWGVRHVRLAKA